MAKGVPGGGYRIWDSRRQRRWDDHDELRPADLLTELNGAADQTRIAVLVKRYRAQKR
ncbi:hypothetical protein V1460_29695 [Streptomyces sp. SCSIO 30461]|uniref:hypothetical protein n=1 Tax=Streptomyces sp. SCSIO 30461 TaxID=3118085 RepID=UPI0030D604CB